MKRDQFQGRVVVITGAASGIGEALCRRFSSAGATVVMLDMNEEGVCMLGDEISQTGCECMTIPCDVTDERACAEAIDTVITRYGGVDILVNNAGITQRSPFRTTGLTVYRKVMDVNFFGTLNCTKPALESLIERKGSIVVTSSHAGYAPLLGRTGYCASKHALHGFFGSLRAELREHGVHVMIVCPGFTQTALQERALDGDGSVTTHPQSRVGNQDTPAHVAEAIFRGAVKKKELLVLTAVGKMTRLLTKLAPSLYERMMIRSLEKELQRDND